MGSYQKGQKMFCLINGRLTIVKLKVLHMEFSDNEKFVDMSLMGAKATYWDIAMMKLIKL